VQKNTVNDYVKNAQIVDPVMISNFANSDIRKPARNKLSMPFSRLIKRSGFAVSNIHANRCFGTNAFE